VVSPIDGVVVERLTSPGSPVGTGPDRHAAHVLHVYDPASLQIRADIPLADAARVGVGQTADIVVDLLPETVFRGTVTRFVHRADLAKNTVEAKIRIDDPSPLLKPDMLARVRLHAESDPQTGAARTVTRVFAPENAVRNGVAWVVEGRRGDAGTAHQRAIELGGARIDGWVEVITGLHPGDLIVLEGAVAEGLPVRVRTQDTTIDGRADA
jgi:multidrug efflux pump subunit AcrA (membrane-fusion protein)